MSGAETPSVPPRRTMSPRTARAIEYGIVGASLLALAMIFQPFAQELFTLGAAAIVIVGLAFNLVPLADPTKTMRGFGKGIIVVVVVFAIITLIALGFAEWFAWYIAPTPD